MDQYVQAMDTWFRLATSPRRCLGAVHAFGDFLASTGTAVSPIMPEGFEANTRARIEVHCSFCGALGTTDNCRNCGAARGL